MFWIQKSFAEFDNWCLFILFFTPLYFHSNSAIYGDTQMSLWKWIKWFLNIKHLQTYIASFDVTIFRIFDVQRTGVDVHMIRATILLFEFFTN